ncbi:MAG: aminotransferase class I/II-fold pyridoxal phosphate-dependent enzyme [archaeon]
MTIINSPIAPRLFIGKSGADIISFGSGQPDLLPPFDIKRVFLDYDRFKYGAVGGEDELKNELCKSIKNEFGHVISNDNIVVTNGASEALDLALRHVFTLTYRKKILLTKPYYYSYPELVKINRMEPIYTDDDIDLEDIKEKSKICSALIINSPANPTGKTIRKSVLRGIQEITEDNDCTLISDEVYHSLTYGAKHHSVKGDNVLTINSFSKTYSLCGYRIGYMFCHDADLMCKISDIKSHTSMNTSILSQKIAMECLKAPKEHIIRNREIFRKRRDHIYRRIIGLGLEVKKPDGAFYIMPRVKDSMKMSTELYYKHKVVTYPGDWFGAPGHVRLSFALDIEKIDEGIRRIESYLSYQ